MDESAACQNVFVVVAWPGRRADVMNALDVLAAFRPELTDDGKDPRWPDVTVAVHWLVDDTGWEVQDPVASVGTILRDETEAHAIRDIVAAVVLASNRQGPTASDAHWFRDEGWSEVRRAAGNAAAVLGKGEHIERLAAGNGCHWRGSRPPSRGHDIKIVNLPEAVVGVVDVIDVTDARPHQPPDDYPPVGRQVEAIVLGYTPNGQLRLSLRNSDLDPAQEPSAE